MISSVIPSLSQSSDLDQTVYLSAGGGATWSGKLYLVVDKYFTYILSTCYFYEIHAVTIDFLLTSK